MIYRIPIVTLLLILAIWAPRVQGGDRYSFEVFIRCDESVPHWCGKLIIYEEDDRDHDIIKTEHFCTNQTTMNFVYPDVDPEGDWGFEYEFKYRLEHTCATDGSERCIQMLDAVDAPMGYFRNIHWYIKAIDSGRPQCWVDGL